MANTYNVYFGLPGNLIEIAEGQSGLSIIVPYTLGYNIEYNWRVDTDTGSETITGDVWSFTALVYDPPFPSGITLKYEGDEGYPGDPGDGPLPAGTATGVNNIATLKRIVAAANNKIFYET
ncbi:hypothetical protein LCGC14_2194350 [marine sediment metagenome]|uniref:Uncharacterized protein n=1 Tax=marine sediment metagenome TaxID=412755 RepID=A0A0F9DIR1_9ZZZZ